MKKKSPEELKSLFLEIQGEADLILVGGQAVNFWAVAYQSQIPELEEYRPFSSQDIDFLGGKVEASICHQILGGTLKLNKNFSPSPNTGVLVTNFQNEQLRIDFLSSVFGLNDDEIYKSAIEFKGQDLLAGVSLKILNPILTLESKLKSLVGLPQVGRQDRKHLKIAILIANKYLTELCTSKKPRVGLNLIERLYRTAKSDAGLQVWMENEIDITQAIPEIVVRDLDDTKWQRFCQIRLPQVKDDLAKKRAKYKQIMTQREQRDVGIEGN